MERRATATRAPRLRGAWADPVFRLLGVAVVTDLAVGTVVYHFVEGWRWIDALYFCVVTQATVGFGDFTPHTDAGKLFTILYIFVGLALIVAFAQRLGRHIFTGLYARAASLEPGVGDALERGTGGAAGRIVTPLAGRDDRSATAPPDETPR